MVRKVALMSIRPEYAEKVFSGDKQIELRRQRPQLEAGDIVVVYVTSPLCEVAGAFSVAGIVSLDLPGRGDDVAATQVGSRGASRRIPVLLRAARAAARHSNRSRVEREADDAPGASPSLRRILPATATCSGRTGGRCPMRGSADVRVDADALGA